MIVRRERARHSTSVTERPPIESSGVTSYRGDNAVPLEWRGDALPGETRRAPHADTRAALERCKRPLPSPLTRDLPRRSPRDRPVQRRSRSYSPSEALRNRALTVRVGGRPADRIAVQTPCAVSTDSMTSGDLRRRTGGAGAGGSPDGGCGATRTGGHRRGVVRSPASVAREWC